MRNELKKKTGIEVDEYGQKINEEPAEDALKLTYEPLDNPKQNFNEKSKGPKREYASTKSYRPSGNLVYDEELLNKIEDRFT